MNIPQLFNHLLVEGHLGCFSLGPLSMGCYSIHVQVFGEHVFISLGLMPKNAIDGSYSY
jgi:hypothetical protein